MIIILDIWKSDFLKKWFQWNIENIVMIIIKYLH